jgi:hypothetical protein
MGDAKRRRNRGTNGKPPEPPPMFPTKLPSVIQFVLMRERIEDIVRVGGDNHNICRLNNAVRYAKEAVLFDFGNLDNLELGGRY